MTVSSTSGTTSTSDSASGAAPLVVNGLISGIDTQSVIQALLESYQIPITNLQDQQSTLSSQASDYQTINSDMQALLTAAEALNTPSSWDLMTASSSDPSVATATASSGALAGSLGFTVDQLAQGNVLVSEDGVSSTGDTVTDLSSFLVATGAAALGFSSLGAGSGLSLGSHQIQVTQSSAAASVTGTAVGADTSVTTGQNDTLDLTVNGTDYTLTLGAGEYTPAQLATAVDQAATTASAPVTASVNGSGQLVLSTTEQGGDASLSVTGGDALASLGLTAGQAGTGTNAVVEVDGTATTLDAIDPGQQVTLSAPTGTVQATVAGSPGASGALIATGTADAAVVSAGNGSLAQVVDNINAAGLGVAAEAVQESSGQYLLQVSADQTGLSGAVSIDPAAFSGSSLGGLQTIAQAQDAEITVGGAGGYSLTSSTDTFSDLLPGTNVTVTGTGQATVTVSADAAGEASQVQSLVTAANQALSDIQSLAGYNESTKTAGPLMGSAVLQGIQEQILSIFSNVSGTSGLGDSGDVGITLNSDGSLSFDESTFEQAFQSNPSQVASLFTQGTTFAASEPAYAGQVSLVYAGNDTDAGTYDVSISQSATQATDTGSTLSGGTVTTPETLTVTQGGQTATYSTTDGESLSAVAAGLNSAFASAGLGLSADALDGATQLQLTRDDYGSAQSFTVTSSAAGAGTTGLGAGAGTPVTFTGTDVQGTIDGIAATGNGQELSAPTDDPTLDGLAVLVTTPGITSTTDLGSITYSPGVAQQLVTVADAASNASTGSISTAIQGLDNESTGLDSGIAMYQQIESSQQTVLQNEFANMESTLGTLKSESEMLSSQIDQLTGF